MFLWNKKRQILIKSIALLIALMALMICIIAMGMTIPVITGIIFLKLF